LETPSEGVAAIVLPSRRDATLSGLAAFACITQGSSQARNPGLSDGIPSGFTDGALRGKYDYGILKLCRAVEIRAKL
jgi:hypothetical protein